MTYKMIVLDLDDTLLTSDHTISPRTKDALLAAQRRGKKVVLASGRPTYAMLDLAEELELARYGSYILSFNGASIIDCKTNESLFLSTLSPETVHCLYDLSKREDVYIHTYVGDEILTEQSNEYTTLEGKLTGMDVVPVTDFKAAIQTPVVKCLMMAEETHLARVEQTLQQELAGKLAVARSKPFFLEFTEDGVTKGTSLALLSEKLGIAQEEVIACGDGNNDLSMIEWAGLGVAMANAADTVKEKAQYMTASNDEDGVALVVEKFMMDEEPAISSR
ncbi:Cof-type HAD-IIB family hydrolase [uncultured Exiguobacterium sp.]|uniref:Cof-type HAD-IIB family hydrolase n=1 Tax=uncultured Exiguobacterium sp. TaxID=202669 RepID=UPI0025DECF22|nr:Cof-type HAD-IIB family hydrolase [uncultured Exiguobacterium sp.]